MDRTEEKKTILEKIFTSDNVTLGGIILISTVIGVIGGHYVYEHVYNKKEK
jgi:hypothetical protein